MNYKELIKRLKYYGNTYAIGDNLGREVDGTDKIILKATDAIETLLEERDAAVAELERIADFTEEDFWGYLNNTIHGECGYEYYCHLFDLLCQVTNWEYDDKWCGHMKGKSNGSK